MKRRTCIVAATCAALAGAIIASAVVIVAGRHADGKAVFWDDDSAVSIDVSAFE